MLSHALLSSFKFQPKTFVWIQSIFRTFWKEMHVIALFYFKSERFICSIGFHLVSEFVLTLKSTKIEFRYWWKLAHFEPDWRWIGSSELQKSSVCWAFNPLSKAIFFNSALRKSILYINMLDKTDRITPTSATASLVPSDYIFIFPYFIFNSNFAMHKFLDSQSRISWFCLIREVKSWFTDLCLIHVYFNPRTYITDIHYIYNRYVIFYCNCCVEMVCMLFLFCKLRCWCKQKR